MDLVNPQRTSGGSNPPADLSAPAALRCTGDLETNESALHVYVCCMKLQRAAAAAGGRLLSGSNRNGGDDCHLLEKDGNRFQTTFTLGNTRSSDYFLIKSPFKWLFWASGYGKPKRSIIALRSAIKTEYWS